MSPHLAECGAKELEAGELIAASPLVPTEPGERVHEDREDEGGAERAGEVDAGDLVGGSEGGGRHEVVPGLGGRVVLGLVQLGGAELRAAAGQGLLAHREVVRHARGVH